MPRRLRINKRRANPLAQLDGPDWLTLLAGWTPPNDRDRTKLRTIEDCRAAWELHGEDGFLQPNECGRRPWAWWEFDAPKSDANLSEYARLAKWNLLTDDNIRWLRERFDLQRHLHRGTHTLSPGDFDAIEEGEALGWLGLLTPDEQIFVRAAREEWDAWEREQEESETDDAGKDTAP